MAKVESITYESSIATFLKADEVDAAVESFNEGGLDAIDSEFTQLIKDEMDRGLSLQALSINGRAPLNDIAREMTARIVVTLDDIDELKLMAEGEGNIHRQREANKYWQEVKKHYKELWDTCQDAVDAYNGDRKYADGKDDDGNTKYSYYKECEITKASNYENEIAMPKTPDSRSSHASKVNSTFEAAKAFYSKVEEAKKLYDECQGLNVSLVGIGIHVSPEDAEKIVGVQPGAKKETNTTDGGNIITETYTNPDDSVVVIEKTKDGKVISHKVTHRDGWLQEEVKYDDNGNPTKRVEYKRRQLAEGKSAFEVQSTEYEYKDGKFSDEGTDGESFYQYRDNNGKVRTSTDEPDMSDVANKSGRTNADKEFSSGEGEASDYSGTPAPPAPGKEEVKYGETVQMGGETYVKANGFDQVNEEAIKNHKPFVLKSGDKIFYDADEIIGGYNFYDSENDLYFKYDESSGKYRAYYEDGKQYGNKHYLNPEKFMDGVNRRYLDADYGQAGEHLWDNHSRFEPASKK